MVKIDPHSGCLLPVTASEIRESMLLLGWKESEVRILFDYTSELPDGTPAGHFIEITGPTGKPAFDPTAFELDGTQVPDQIIAEMIGSLVSGGYSLPPTGPIISFGWHSRAAATEALHLALSQLDIQSAA